MGRQSSFLVACVAFALGWAGAAGASGYSRADVTLPMDDGVQIAATLYVPTGTAPATGWPGVMLFHGLGGSRDDMAPIAETFLAGEGYAVLTFDARGHGESGGLVTLDGPREIQDVRTLFGWFGARADVDETHVGALGFSYGGGAIWRSTVEGVPFAAIEPAITWTDLYGSLFPQDLSKSGAIAIFLSEIPQSRSSPLIEGVRNDLFGSTNLASIRSLSEERSSLPGLGGVKTPTFMLQGRRDFAFGIDQAANAYIRLKGPKRLYIGDLGHTPAANPAAEQPYYLTECRLWFDRFLKGEPNGIDRAAPVEVARDPWTGKTAKYEGLPRRQRLVFTLRGRKTIGAEDKIVRSVKLPRLVLEQFGSPVVRVTGTSSTGWSHLVAVLTAVTPGGKEIVVSEGGAATSFSTSPTTVSIRLIDDATLIPRGSRLRLTLAGTSTAQHPQNLLYFVNVPPTQRLTVGRVQLRLPVLRKAISK